MPLTSFNGVIQTTPNSCGAFALAAALGNFGLATQQHDSMLLNTGDLTLGYNQPAANPISNAGTPADFGNSIYPVTGNLLLAASSTYQYLTPVQNMNPPSALVYVATLFGFATGQIRVQYTNAGGQAFGAITVTNHGNGGDLLATEIDLLGLINNGGDMVIAGPMDYTGIPKDGNMVQLIVVQGGQHWLTINDTQLYDPGTGFVGPYELTINGDGQLSFDYVLPGGPVSNDFSGIWIELRRS